jgi:antitoxin YefM
MNVVNYSDFRGSLKKYLDAVTNDHDTLIVPRANDKSVVIISLDEYNSLTETMYLIKSEANRARLQEALIRADQGIQESHELID